MIGVLIVSIKFNLLEVKGLSQATNIFFIGRKKCMGKMRTQKSDIISVQLKSILTLYNNIDIDINIIKPLSYFNISYFLLLLHQASITDLLVDG